MRIAASTIPGRISVKETPNDRRVLFRWHSPQSKWLLLFVICSPLALEIGWADLLQSRLAQVLLIVLDGSFLYIAVAGWINVTCFGLSRGKLQVRHRPLPWPGKTVRLAEVRAFEVEEYYVPNDVGERLTFRLYARLINGRRIRLASSFEKDDRAAAEFVQAHLTVWHQADQAAR